MILVSNNVQNKIELPKSATIRINMAWVKTIKELKVIIESNINRDIFLDYPQGRSKPPRPVLSIDDAIEVMNLYSNIKYFAVSNIEKVSHVKSIQESITSQVEFVPKIETETGVLNLETLINECNIKTIMLDKEDLFVDVEQDNTEFYKDIALVKQICKEKKVRLLELQGVIFIGEDV